LYTPRTSLQQLKVNARATAADGEWRKASSHPPLFLLGILGRISKRPDRVIHAWFNRLTWKRRTSKLNSRRAYFRRIWKWPIKLRNQICKQSQKYGPAVAGTTAKSLWRQRLELWYLGLVFSIPPRSYYLFRLFENDRRRNASFYLHRFETKVALLQLLNVNLGSTEADKLLGDKWAFAARCKENHLPTPPIYLELNAGKIILRDIAKEQLPAFDLIVKPRVGRGGHVMMRWEYLGAGRYQSNSGEERQADALIKKLRAESKKTSFIVTKRMVNHSDILGFAGPGGKILTTCRMVTGIDENGEPELLSATYKIAVTQTVADNVHFGGLASAVNIETGELGYAISTAPLGVPIDVHPVSGLRITGTRLPLWTESVSLVKRAHLGFPEAIFIGWDIGITDQGPILIEGNSGLCVHLQQTPQGEPLGAGRFGELMAYHLNRIDPSTADFQTPPFKE